VTMLRTYAAWAEGAVEADVQGIERSMQLTPRQAPLARPIARCRYGRGAPFKEVPSLTGQNLAADLPAARVIEGESTHV
jgi:hypothetical protein